MVSTEYCGAKVSLPAGVLEGIGGLLLHGAVMPLNLQRHDGKFTQLHYSGEWSQALRGAIGVWATGWSRAMGEDQIGSSVKDMVVASVVKLSDQK